MVDMNTVIGVNINTCLMKRNRKQTELADYLEGSRQTVNKMISGIRGVNAAELRKIAEFCGVSMEMLTTVPDNYQEMDALHVFMGQVKTEAARDAIRDIDTMIDLILFHSEVRENGQVMMEEWEEL